MPPQPSTVAEQYALALLDVLESAPQGERARCEEELGALADAVAADAEVRRFLASPTVAQDRKSALLLKVLSGAQPLTRRFLEVLARRGRAELLPEAHAAYRRLSEERQGVLVAEVTTAVPLGAEARQGWTEALQEGSGRPVRLTEKVDPRLIGGARTRIGSQVYDGSVRGRLALLRRKLLGD